MESVDHDAGTLMVHSLRLFWWRHFGAGRHFWRDLYLETILAYDHEQSRAESKARIIRELRNQQARCRRAGA